MAAYGGQDGVGNAAGDVTSLRTNNINVTGSDLCLVVHVAETESVSRDFTIVWDPDGNNESMTGEIANLDPGSYLGTEVEYLDDPTAANAPAEATFSVLGEVAIRGVFFTAAGDVVSADSATDSFNTTGTSLSATPGNVTTGDMVVDFVTVGQQLAIAAGANQTERGSDVDSGSYLRIGCSTQDGADGGVMSWTTGSQSYGAALVALRIPDATTTDALLADDLQSLSEVGTPALAEPILITDVNTTESWNDGDTGIVITGQKFT